MKHIANMSGEEGEREKIALVRWLSVHPRELFVIFGLPPHSWCGLFLKRAALFAERSSGDLDFIAGSLESLLDAEGRATPVWPPSVDHLITCEVKVSRYTREEPIGMRFSPSYQNHGRRLAGALRARQRFGFVRIGFLHLAFVKPVSAPGHNDWMLNGILAHEAVKEMVPLFAEQDAPGCGYIIAAQGGVPHKEEHFAGAGGAPRVVRAPANLWTNAEAQVMRAKLLETLRTCPRPANLTPTLRHCPTCGALTMVPSAVRCACPETDLYLLDPTLP